MNKSVSAAQLPGSGSLRLLLNGSIKVLALPLPSFHAWSLVAKSHCRYRIDCCSYVIVVFLLLLLVMLYALYGSAWAKLFQQFARASNPAPARLATVRERFVFHQPMNQCQNYVSVQRSARLSNIVSLLLSDSTWMLCIRLGTVCPRCSIATHLDLDHLSHMRFRLCLSTFIYPLRPHSRINGSEMVQ